MFKCLNIPKSTFYYKPTIKTVDTDFENAVIDEFNKSRKNYGTRKLKKVLRKRNVVASRKRISKVMHKYNLVSNYKKTYA